MPQPATTTTKRTYIHPSQDVDPLLGDGQYSNKMRLFPMSGLAPPPTRRELTGHAVPPSQHHRRSSHPHNHHHHHSHQHNHSHPTSHGHNSHHTHHDNHPTHTTRREITHTTSKAYHSDSRRRHSDPNHHHSHGGRRAIVDQPARSSPRSSGEEVRRVGAGRREYGSVGSHRTSGGHDHGGHGGGREREREHKVIVKEYVR